MDFVLALCAAAEGRSSRVLWCALGWGFEWGVEVLWGCGGGSGAGVGEVGEGGRDAVMGEDMVGGGALEDELLLWGWRGCIIWILFA